MTKLTFTKDDPPPPESLPDAPRARAASAAAAAPPEAPGDNAAVDAAPELPEVLADFDRWLAVHGIETRRDATPVFCGDWDLGKVMTTRAFVFCFSLF